MLLWFGVKSPARKCRPGLSNCLVEVSCKEGHEGHGDVDGKGDHDLDCNCHDVHILIGHITLREGGEEMVGN